MSGIKCVVFVVVLTFLPSLAIEDVEVSCVFMERCVLPCSFQGGSDTVIHWIQERAGNTPVHIYYRNQDQLAKQGQRFKNRTSLFKDQISRGNASLQLTGVKVEDQGRYKCYTSINTIDGNKDSFINLMVNAPVRKVDIEQVDYRITCSSEGIYPEPELIWSTSFNTTLQDQPTVQKTEHQLYNISSSLTLSDSDTDLVYSCNVSTRRDWRRATLFRPTSINGQDTETTIPCNSSNAPLTGFIWRFNQSQIILNQTRTDVPYTVSKEWRQQVKSVSESGSLTLQDLSSDQEGTYTCELSNEQETYITNTVLRIEKGQGNSASVGAIIFGVILAVALIIGLAAVMKSRRTQRRRQQQQQQLQQQQQPQQPQQQPQEEEEEEEKKEEEEEEEQEEEEEEQEQEQEEPLLEHDDNPSASGNDSESDAH